MTNELLYAIHFAPLGTWGYVIAPWSQDEVYGVAARWSNASSHVYIYRDDIGWFKSVKQVADYQHEPLKAMEEQLRISLVYSDKSGEESTDLVKNAISF